MKNELMVDHPQRILSAGLGGPGWIKPGDGLDNFMELARSLEEGNGIAPVLKSMTPEGEAPPSEEQIAQMNAALASYNDLKAVAACLRNMGSLSISEEQLRLIRVPCLFLFGSQDDNKKEILSTDKIMPSFASCVEIEGAIQRFFVDHAAGHGGRP